ncbi:MAG TPA: universal stress protein [Acidimicrobiia bacterium]|nr:universal stress protein [Acidimicrobiia bacterium]
MPTAGDAYELERRADEFGWRGDGWSIVHDDDAASGIVRHVSRRDDTLLVMATSARSPWSSSVLGSITHDVLGRIHRPVLLVGPHVSWTEQPPCTTLVPCIGGAEAAERAVPAIVSWQQTFTSPAPQLAAVVPVEADASVAERRLGRMAELLAAQHVRADTRIIRDPDPVAALETLASRFVGPVHVAISARYTDDRLHWHSTTQRLIREATCPVLVVPAQPVSPPLRAAAEDRSVHLPFLDRTVPVARAPS